jgi:hypothetical protein
MAVWQFTLYLLPRSELRRLFRAMPEVLQRTEFESTEWWQQQQPPRDYEAILDSFLPRVARWSPMLKGWGRDDGDHVDVRVERDRVTEIWARVDVRTLDARFVEHLVRFATHCDCIFLAAEELRLLEPELGVVLNHIEGSRASRFVRSPEAYFNDRKRAE